VHEQPLVSPKAEAQLTLAQYQEIYDRLIRIFQERPRDDWKKLIVFSKQWEQHKQGVMDRWGGLRKGAAGALHPGSGMQGMIAYSSCTCSVHELHSSRSSRGAAEEQQILCVRRLLQPCCLIKAHSGALLLHSK
jgi:hypothetical protein